MCYDTSSCSLVITLVEKDSRRLLTARDLQTASLNFNLVATDQNGVYDPITIPFTLEGTLQELAQLVDIDTSNIYEPFFLDSNINKSITVVQGEPQEIALLLVSTTY